MKKVHLFMLVLGGGSHNIQQLRGCSSSLQYAYRG